MEPPLWQKIDCLDLVYRTWHFFDSHNEEVILFEYPDGTCSVHTNEYQAMLVCNFSQIVVCDTSRNGGMDWEGERYDIDDAILLYKAYRDNVYILAQPYRAVARLIHGLMLLHRALSQQKEQELPMPNPLHIPISGNSAPVGV